MATENICPHCGKPVPPTALQGICPECMLKAGLAAETGEVGPDGTVVRKPAPTAPPVEEIAPHFPQLEIIECLGRGGMGVVYKARQPKLDRFVALKILARSRDSGISDTEFAARFQQEARALARLNHPDIVAVYDFGEAGGFHYLLMEYVDGLTLRQLLQTRMLSPEEALSIVPKICEALQFAHERGIVHRDIKPENILLDKQGRVKIADFGIAKILGAELPGPTLTGAKDRLGTPHYMAPEQIEKPATVDHRADIFSLGVVFYEMLTGELPLGKFQPPSRKVQVDVRLDEIVLHALEKEPERRYQHASEVKTDVETITQTPTAESPAQFTNKHHKAPWSQGLVLWSSLLSVVCLSMAFKCFMRGGGSSVLIGTSLLALTFGCALFAIRGYTIKSDAILIHRLFWATRLPLAGLLSARFEMGATQWAIRAGNGGFFSCTGLRYNRRLGLHRVFATDGMHTVVLRFANRIVVVSPGDPESFVRDVTAAAIGRKQTRRATSAATPSLGSSQREEAQTAKADVGGQNPKGDQSLMTPAATTGWVTAVRWTARVCGTLLLIFFGVFFLAEGLPAIAAQPEGVQLNFAALALMLIGFIIGWKRDGAAAILIALGWTLWHISEGHMRWNIFQTPLPVAMLYGFCWWATHGRRTRIVVAVLVTLAVLLGLGRLFVPTSVFVRGSVVDAQTGMPVPNVEMRLLPQPARSLGKDDRPNARGDKNGRFTLYVGWYTQRKEVAISATGYSSLTTQLGPRALGERNVSRDFKLQPAASATVEAKVPPVVIETFPESGATGVDPALTEIRATFSKPMQDGSWAWTKWGEENFPELTGQPKYLEDGRTCVLPVKLQPGKVYAIWLNSDYFHDFKDREGQAALSYLLIFETRK